MIIDVIYTPDDYWRYTGDWLAGDISWTAFDTETMGKQWYILSQEYLNPATPDERRKALEKMMDDLKKAGEALDPKKNHLATAQFGNRDEHCLIFVLKDKEVNRLARDFFLMLDLEVESELEWVVQNSKFDLKQIDYHWDVRPVRQVYDTMLVETLTIGDRNADSASLKPTAERRLPGDFRKGDSKWSVSDWWTLPLDDEQAYYGAMDVVVPIKIRVSQEKDIWSKKLNHVVALENNVTPALVSMEKVGVKIDREKLREFVTRAGIKADDYEAEFHETFPDVNPNSPQQVLEAVEKHYGIRPTKMAWDKETMGFVEKPSVDKDTLLKYGIRFDPPMKAMIAAKELRKNIQLGTTWMGYEDGRFFTEFIQLKRWGEAWEKSGGTRTGRMSSTPNLQNLINLMKQFLIADDGWSILSADYSAIELRLIASYAAEQLLKDAFNEGRDPHTEMAAWAFNMPMDRIGKKSKERRIAKEVNFGFIYGMSGRTFTNRVLRATEGEIRLSVDEGNEFRNKFFERYKDIKRWHDAQFANACLHGYVTTRSGRRREYNWSNRPSDVRPTGRMFHPVHHTWFQSSYATDWKWRNIGFNTPIQGTGSDGIKNSIVKLHRRSPDWLRPFATVHDSIDCLVRDDYREEGARLLTDIMIEGMARYMSDVAVEVEVTCGKSWASAPSTKLNPDGSVREKGLDKLLEENPGKSASELIRQVEVDYGLWFNHEFQEEIKIAKAVAA